MPKKINLPVRFAPNVFYIFTCLLFWIYLPFIIDEGERFDS